MIRRPRPRLARLPGIALASAAGPALVLALVTGRARGYADDPPPAHTGGFGEPTCHACHYGAALNPPGGGLRLQGLPERYAPGRTYEVTVVLRGNGLARAGFQLSTRFAAGERRGRQAGALVPADVSATVTAAGEPAIDYAHQTLAGSRAADTGEARWTLRWTAPAGASSDVAFHVAANVADDDASPFGDLVYTDSARVPPAREARPAHPPRGEVIP